MLPENLVSSQRRRLYLAIQLHASSLDKSRLIYLGCLERVLLKNCYFAVETANIAVGLINY